jgi:ribosomal protein L11 methyltransferase
LDNGRRSPALDVRPVPEWFDAALVDCGVVAIDEKQAGWWRVFFRDAIGRDHALASLHRQFPAVAIEPVDVPDEDWAARAQAGLRAVRIGRIVVAPPWDVPPDTGQGAATTVVIRPSMGFGTGHHATTRLCLAALERLGLDGESVIDAGTGSGVLAIAASLLGASCVVGFDDDADAIAAARENLDLNTSAHVDLIVGDLRTIGLAPADLVTANLTGALLEQAAPRLASLAKVGGRLVVSGLAADEEPRVRAAFAGMELEHRGAEDEWIGLTLRRASPAR